MADFYHSVAPILHWNYAAAVGRNTPFSEVREADLSPLAGGGAGARASSSSVDPDTDLPSEVVASASHVPAPA